MRFLSTFFALIVYYLFLFFGHLYLPSTQMSKSFTVDDFNGWFDTCNKVNTACTQKITDFAVSKFNQYLMNLAKTFKVDVSSIDISDKVVQGFVFACSFVNKQSISSIRSIVYFGLKRHLKHAKQWGLVQLENFSHSFLSAVQRLKVSDQFIPSKTSLDPILDEDLLNIVSAIPASLPELKALVAGVLSLSLSCGARSISLANVHVGEILQCVKVFD